MADKRSHRTEGTSVALATGTRLDEFEIIGLISEGSFGIVYSAHDHFLQRRVALKEYLPSSLATRLAGSTRVQLKKEPRHEAFEEGLRAFMLEARMLASLDHPSLVKVYRFWEGNDTAYRVMPYLEGRSLGDVLPDADRNGQAASEDWLRGMLGQLSEALQVLHAEGVYHRLLAPQSVIFLQRSSRWVLTGFEAARWAIDDKSDTLTSIIRPGFAPIEQYAGFTGARPGPWTDIYSLAAIAYLAITGKSPPQAVDRTAGDSYAPIVQVAPVSYSPGLLQAIDVALSLHPIDRPQSIAEFRKQLGFGNPVAEPRAVPSVPPAAYTSAPQRMSTQAPPRASASRTGPMPTRSSGGALTTVLGGALAAAIALPVAVGRIASTTWQRMRVRRTAPDAALQKDAFLGPTERDATSAAMSYAAAKAEPLQFGISAPRRCTAGAEISVLFAAYVGSERGAMLAQLQALADASHRQMVDLPPDRGAVWSVGTPFTVRLIGRHFQCQMPERGFEWNGRRNQVGFSVSVNADAPPSAVLEISVWVQDLCVAAYPVQLQVDRQAMPVAQWLLPATEVNDEQRSEALAPQSLFASYASKDAQEVTGRLSTLARFAPGLDIFQDCLDLTPNELFKPQLEAQIKARDAFLLFWSRNAQQSKWVQWEIETALATKGKSAIMPMPLEDPAIAPPPAEFGDDHLRDRFMLAGYALRKIAELAHAAIEPPRS